MSKTFIENIEDNSPADHAGLAVDDFIIHINNIDVSTYSLSEIVSLIRQESAATNDDIRGNYLEFHVIHVVKIKKFDSEMVERLESHTKSILNTEPKTKKITNIEPSRSSSALIDEFQQELHATLRRKRTGSKNRNNTTAISHFVNPNPENPIRFRNPRPPLIARPPISPRRVSSMNRNNHFVPSTEENFLDKDSYRNSYSYICTSPSSISSSSSSNLSSTNSAKSKSSSTTTSLDLKNPNSSQSNKTLEQAENLIVVNRNVVKQRLSGKISKLKEDNDLALKLALQAKIQAQQQNDGNHNNSKNSLMTTSSKISQKSSSTNSIMPINFTPATSFVWSGNNSNQYQNYNNHSSNSNYINNDEFMEIGSIYSQTMSQTDAHPKSINRDSSNKTNNENPIIDACSETSIQIPHLNKKTWSSWSTTQVSLWLQEIGLHQYSKKFVENDINGSHLKELDKETLSELGIDKLGHRMVFQREVKKLGSGTNH